MTARLTKRDLLEYALEGVRFRIGSHAEPLKYPEEIEEYEDHAEELERRLARLGQRDKEKAK